MSEYVIFTDSCTDLPASLAQELNLEVLPFSYRIDGTDYKNLLDHSELSSSTFYNLLKDGKQSSTSLVNEIAYEEAFESVLKAGKDILYLCFSSALSGSFNQANLAAETLREKYPERQIFVEDTKAASMGEGLLVYYAAKAKQEGKTITEVLEYTRELTPKLCHWFTVADLDHLRRGGRISGVVAVAGTLLGIKPILHVDDEGRLINVDKVRGRNKSIEHLANQMEKTAIDPASQTVFISHGDCVLEAQKLADIIKERMGVKDFVISTIGPVIGSHAGPGTIALFFVGTPR